MHTPSSASDDELIDRADALHIEIARRQRDLFCLIAELDRRAVWRDTGARDMAHWVGVRFGISHWKAQRWIAAAHALEDLPLIGQALASGELGIDKVVELTRFASPETEARLIRWAASVSCGCIRRRAELEARPTVDEAEEVDRARSVSWWYFDEGRRFGLSAELPAADGAVVARALDRLAESLPAMPGEERAWVIDARRADALVAMASARLAVDADPDRATVVVHASLESLATGEGGCQTEGGGVIHAETARRLLCSGRFQTVVEDSGRQPVRLGRMTREPPAWMVRQLRYRDGECRFPGCGARRFTEGHHIVWWEAGGPTDLDNLVLLCSFHHKLVHEYGWRVERDARGTTSWFRPDGTGYRAGPSPSMDVAELPVGA